MRIQKKNNLIGMCLHFTQVSTLYTGLPIPKFMSMVSVHWTYFNENVTWYWVIFESSVNMSIISPVYSMDTAMAIINSLYKFSE